MKFMFDFLSQYTIKPYTKPPLLSETGGFCFLTPSAATFSQVNKNLDILKRKIERGHAYGMFF